MSIKKKLLLKIMGGAQDGNVTYAEALKLLELLGYRFREGKGSHTVACYPGTPGLLTLQPKKDGKAKSYQLEQIRRDIREKGLHLQ
ncbi:type II toxin-antitoxin system HicA family toxin [Akkermansia glycaniphila]|uniref:type II toxin-antitoxin system HicA family toxin n=1 Tax=Akkermansia glycaniphila TaxID=1679444 RepID=UPI001C012BF1|nr:type II toxin-antitoxin system HicA family toxin [Akkermansia glycaniphila]